MTEDLMVMLAGWRAEIEAEAADTLAELTTARKTAEEREEAEAEAARRHGAMTLFINTAANPHDGLALPVRRRLERAKPELSGMSSAGWRQKVVSLEYELTELRGALVQINKLLSPPVAVPVTDEPEPEPTNPQDFDIIQFMPPLVAHHFAKES